MYAFMTTPRSSSGGEVCLQIEDSSFKDTPGGDSDFILDLLC